MKKSCKMNNIYLPSSPFFFDTSLQWGDFDLLSTTSVTKEIIKMKSIHTEHIN